MNTSASRPWSKLSLPCNYWEKGVLDCLRGFYMFWCFHWLETVKIDRAILHEGQNFTK